MAHQVSDRTWRLFQEVIVPAVLGNSAWACLTVLLREGISPSTLARILTLVLLTVFLIGDWIGGTVTPVIKSRLFTPATTASYLLISAYAISTAEKPELSSYFLVALFLVIAVGYSTNAWIRESELASSEVQRRRRYLVIASIVCASLLIALTVLGLSSGPFPELLLSASTATGPILLAVFVCFWRYFRVAAER